MDETTKKIIMSLDRAEIFSLMKNADCFVDASIPLATLRETMLNAVTSGRIEKQHVLTHPMSTGSEKLVAGLKYTMAYSEMGNETCGDCEHCSTEVTRRCKLNPAQPFVIDVQRGWCKFITVEGVKRASRGRSNS